MAPNTNVQSTQRVRSDEIHASLGWSFDETDCAASSEDSRKPGDLPLAAEHDEPPSLHVLRHLAGGSTFDPPAFLVRGDALMSSDTPKVPLWCVVQADGDKAYLTSAGAVPIQYCRMGDSPQLIQEAMGRALRISGPRQVVATVADSHRGWWSGPLWCVAPQRRIVDEMTGRLTVTLAAALALIERAAPEALIVIQPTDAFCASERAFVGGVARALYALQGLPAHMIALTLEPYPSASGHDYLLLGSEDGLPGRPAVRFVKRPPPVIADNLVATGARLSTGVYVARLSTVASILERAWPGLMSAARALGARESGELFTPARMAGSQFSRPWRHTWVQRPIPRLRAVSVDTYGWSSVATVARDASRVG